VEETRVNNILLGKAHRTANNSFIVLGRKKGWARERDMMSADRKNGEGSRILTATKGDEGEKTRKREADSTGGTMRKLVKKKNGGGRNGPLNSFIRNDSQKEKNGRRITPTALHG